jgi:hypothetical protein
MKRRVFALTLLLPLIFVVRCTKNTSEEKHSTILPNAQSCEVIKGDTVNRTDANGFKQGPWIVFQMRRSSIPVEEGSYVNNEKDGVWKYYDSSGKLMRLVKFKNGRAF